MEKIVDKIKNIKFMLGIIVSIVVFISGLFMTMHTVLNKNDEILATLKTTQQMALKSVIWNEEIPLPERASACDAYLSAGYNSLTKRECEEIINKGAENGIFSYLESEVKQNVGSDTIKFIGNYNSFNRNNNNILGYSY